MDIGLTFQTTNSIPQDQFIRIPSLRNIASTAPYMHDGRFNTLLEVIEHYDDEVANRNTVDIRLLEEEGGHPRKLNLNEEEKENLVSFLETLSDPAVEQLEKYSDPFQ